MEKWSPIPGYVGLYDVSSFGRIWSHISQKVLKPGVAGRGYLKVCLTKPGEKKRYFYLHRLVASTFLPNSANLPQVNHKNGDKHDNVVGNLEWCDNSENGLHSFQALGRESSNKGVFGDKNPRSHEYIVTFPDGATKRIKGLAEFCRQNNLNRPSMSMVASGKRNHHKGFKCESVT